jgi:hypothetical protein
LLPNTGFNPNSNGAGYMSDVAEGIRWAADNGADIINMSLSSPYPSSALLEAVQYAFETRGVLLVASSGNSEASRPEYPADYGQVVAVGASTYNERLAYYSNRGSELCAPGGTDREDLNQDGYPDMVLQQTFNPDTRDVSDFRYYFFAGTSMAAPHVSGVAALMLSANPALDNVAIRESLNLTADPLTGETEPPTLCGSGIVNAHRALQAVLPGQDSAPTITFAAPVDGAVVAGTVEVEMRAADVEDPDGELSVEWNLDGGALQAATFQAATGTFTADWDTAQTEDGEHALGALVTDSAGNTGEAVISVSVANQGPPPSVHIADLDGYSGRYFWIIWYAAVDIAVKDHLGAAVSGARVAISWSDGSVDQCTTGGSGICRIVGYQFKSFRQLTLTVTGVGNTALPYEPSLNSDPDGDGSDGTRITICSPWGC